MTSRAIAPSVRWLVHSYNVCFLLSNNVLGLAGKSVTVAGYLVWLWFDVRGSRGANRWTSAPSGSHQLTWSVRTVVVACLALIGFGYLVNGPHTIPNWDYYKYNLLLAEISKTTLHPAIVWAGDGQAHDLAYYYGLFLPAVYVGHAIALVRDVGVFEMQFLFVFQNVLVASILLFAIVRELPRPVTFLLSLLLIVGLDGWTTILLDRPLFGGVWVNDAHDGGMRVFFWPLRIQDFASYFFWLPGHLISALAVFYACVLLHRDRVRSSADRWFLSTAMVLFVASTSIFALLIGGVCVGGLVLQKQGVHLSNITRWILRERSRVFASSVIVLGFAFFFSDGRLNVDRGLLVNPSLAETGAAKWLLFLVQELGLFAVLGIGFKLRKEYFLLLLLLVGLAAFGARELMMSGAILPLLLLHYLLSERIDFARMGRRKLFLLLLFVIPSVLYDFGGVFDIQDQYQNELTPAQATAREPTNDPELLPVMNWVMRNYIRR